MNYGYPLIKNQHYETTKLYFMTYLGLEKARVTVSERLSLILMIKKFWRLKKKKTVCNFL